MGRGFIYRILEFKKAQLPHLLLDREKEREHFECLLSETAKVTDTWGRYVNLAGKNSESNFFHEIYLTSACSTFIAPELLSSKEAFFANTIAFVDGIHLGITREKQNTS